MSKPLRVDEQVRYIYAAIQHLQHNRSTVELAAELGVSRFTVGRMIQRAREEGLVEVVSRMHDPIDAALSEKLAHRFALDSAFAVVPPTGRQQDLRAAIAAFGAKLVTETVVEDEMIGFTPGRTAQLLCRNIASLATCDVVQLTGVATTDADESLKTVISLSSIAQGRMFPMHAPMLTTTSEAWRSITSQPLIRQAMQRMNQVSTAVLTIGGWPHQSLLAEQLTRFGEIDAPELRDVVAEIGTTFLDGKGQEIHALHNRVIGISTEQLERVERRIAVAGGLGKGPAILSVLRSGLIDTLVTDAATAQHVLSAA